MPRAEDLNSDQSLNTEDRLQRLTVSKGRGPKRHHAYENNKSESPDEAASPLIHRLDSHHSYRKQREPRTKVHQAGSPMNMPASNKAQLVSPQSKRQL